MVMAITIVRLDRDKHALRHGSQWKSLPCRQVAVPIPNPFLSHSCSNPKPLHVSFMSHSCPNHVPFMSHSSPDPKPIHVPFISHSCPMHVPFMSHSCPIHVPFMSHSCPIHIPFMYHQCHSIPRTGIEGNMRENLTSVFQKKPFQTEETN